jgi:hypothetical protein
MDDDDKDNSQKLQPKRGENRVRTRQAAAVHGLAVQYARTDTRKYSFSVRVVDPWNHLPDTVKTAPTKEAFKRELKHSKL